MRFRTAILAAAIALTATASRAAETQSYGGRDMLVHVPPHLLPSGTRALVVVLHGGLGNASRIESAHSETSLNLDAVADRYGFIVVYLNGTPVTRLPFGQMLGWNAGACCGRSATNDVDDVDYIKGAVSDLTARYGIARDRVFGMGHSNGAMMTLRMMCETNVYTAAISISGALETADPSCPEARGKHILAIHGADDENVPVAGGVGHKGLSHVDFKSEAYTAKIFRDSGAIYDLEIVTGADHFLNNIDVALQKADGVSIAQKAVRFFGLGSP